MEAQLEKKEEMDKVDGGQDGTTGTNIEWIDPDISEERRRDDTCGMNGEYSSVGDSIQQDNIPARKIIERNTPARNVMEQSITDGEDVYSQNENKRHRNKQTVLSIIATVTILQGLGFLVVSYFGGSVPFLPRDPLQLIGIMYTVMGLVFMAVSRCRREHDVCRRSANHKCWFRQAENKTASDTKAVITDTDKKND